MGFEKAIERLRRIRDAYGRIHAVTSAVGAESSPEAIDRAVSQRSALFQEIADQELGLEAEARGWQAYIARDTVLGAVVEDIRGLIRTIAELDARVQEIVRKKVNSIRGELFDLGATSKAALAYVSHTRTATLRSAR